MLVIGPMHMNILLAALDSACDSRIQATNCMGVCGFEFARCT